MRYILTLLFILTIFFQAAAKAVPPAGIYSPAQVPAVASQSDPEVIQSEDIASVQDENREETKVKVFPNPATDFIRIEWQTAEQPEMNAELYDLFGRRISQAKSGDSGNHIQIDISTFQRSAYLLKIFTPDGKFSKTYRIVKH